MFSNKDNINTLTSLLVQHGMKHIVVCPGSRNSALAHNFNEHPDITCLPVTDERSAGFMALGLALQSHEPVAVCVTSGSALLNLLPAVAEASYRRCGIVVISADRPAQWIDQLDGQTIKQPGALGHYAACSVNLPEPHDDEQRWHCNRLVNEAMVTLKRTHRPVHINVPVSDPFFIYDTPSLPVERMIEYHGNAAAINDIAADARRVLIVMGQDNEITVPECIQQAATVLHEPLSTSLPNCYTDQMLFAMGDDKTPFMPDLLIFMGGHTVSKRLRQFMRQLPGNCTVVMVDEDGELHDITMHATHLLHTSAQAMLEQLQLPEADSDYLQRWKELRQHVEQRHNAYEPAYSSMKAVKLFEQQYGDATVHYANSMSVRLGTIYCNGHYRYCNRGINGIEGSLSTAAGAALVSPDQRVYCVTGDLSFFYDENALWQQQLGGNLRIVLLNNNMGAIFRNLKGLEGTPARDTLVAASHTLTAEGVCRTFGITFRQATDDASLADGINWLGTVESDRPVLLEVITDAEADEKVFKGYYKNLKQ